MSGSKINGDLFIQHMCARPSKNINGPFDPEKQQVHYYISLLSGMNNKDNLARQLTSFDPGKQHVQYYGIDQFRVSNELVSNSGRSIKGSRYVSIS